MRSRNGLLGNAERGSQKVPAKVKPVSRHHRFVIALHSPETGLPFCRPEKRGEIETSRRQAVNFSSPLCLGIIAKNGHVSRISG